MYIYIHIYIYTHTHTPPPHLFHKRGAGGKYRRILSNVYKANNTPDVLTSMSLGIQNV